MNTVTRPPAEAESRAVAKERLFALAKRFGPQAEVIAEYQGGQEGGDIQARAEDIAELLSRRPCSKEEIADVFGLSVAEVLKYLEVLSAAGRIMEERQGDTVYYRASATV